MVDHFTSPFDIETVPGGSILTCKKCGESTPGRSDNLMQMIAHLLWHLEEKIDEKVKPKEPRPVKAKVVKKRGPRKLKVDKDYKIPLDGDLG